MGLDMYLERETYIGANYDHNEMKVLISIKDKNDNRIIINEDTVTTINESVLYWRKANAIHRWFVENVQNGVDNCQKYYVSLASLHELYDLVTKVLEKKTEEAAMELLPPTAGFFFGSTEIDDWYWQDLEYTKKELEKLFDEHKKRIASGGVLHAPQYVYQSSW